MTDHADGQPSNRCDECGSDYLPDTTQMSHLCAECSHWIYGYPRCEHAFVQGRCCRCGWDGSVSPYVRTLRPMNGCELTLDRFTYLVRTASRHHRKEIAGWVSLTAHVRWGEVFFRDAAGAEVPLPEVHQRCQANDETQRRAYNLFMHYAHFGGG